MTKGQRIRQRREELNIGQTELADKLKISKQTLYKYEADIVTNIPSDKIEEIARALDCTPDYIMGWNDNEGYYINEETAKEAQRVFSDPDTRMLFDAARDAKPENIRFAAEMLKKFKETNPDG